MAGNASPIFARIGKVGLGLIEGSTIGANLGSNLSTNAALIFTADSTNGSIVNEVRVKYGPGTSTAATAFRVWVNNGSDNSVLTNNALIAEITIPVITSSQSAATVDYVVPMPRGGFVLPPGYRMYATIGTYSTGSFQIVAIGGDY